jgi:CelD/BcsL family acetyltransferase involved in cellulose biosynthesis
MKKMNINWSLQSANGFAQAAAVWDELNSRCNNLPFLDSRFIGPLLEVFGSGGEKLVIGTENGRPVAAAIVTRAGMGRWALFQPSQMPLGPLLILPQLSSETVAAGLLKALPGASLALGLTQLDPAANPRPENSEKFSTLDYIQTAWVDIAGEFDDYWAARGKNLRQNMKKQRNKLAAEGVEISFDVIRDAASVSEAIQQYGILETASWKSGEGTAVSLDNDQGRFYKAMLERFCEAGRGVIYRYRFGDQVAAMDLCIESGDVLVILKTAYDGSNKSLSPAFLMREEQFQRLFAEKKISRVEFFGKLMEWHTRWTENSRTLYHANVFRHALLPKLLALRSRSKNKAVAEAESLAPETN